MGIGSFFRGLWGGIKKGATKIWGGLKKGAALVGRIAKPIGRVAQGVGKVISILPGKVGDVGRALQTGGAVARQLTEELPDGAVKDKLTGALDRGLNRGGEYVSKAQQFAQRVSDTGQPYISAGTRIVDRLGTMATDFANH